MVFSINKWVSIHSMSVQLNTFSLQLLIAAFNNILVVALIAAFNDNFQNSFVIMYHAETSLFKSINILIW